MKEVHKLFRIAIIMTILFSVLTLFSFAAAPAENAPAQENGSSAVEVSAPRTTSTGPRTFDSSKNTQQSSSSDGNNSDKKDTTVSSSSSSTGSKASLQDRFYYNFIKDNRYMLLVDGLKNTLIITFFAMIIGVVFGFLLAVIRVAHDKNGGLFILNLIAKLYITVIRGTPVLVQLMIIYYVIFTSPDIDRTTVGIIGFGINSSAYVAEVVRSGIMSIDIGQFEAGKSLGLKFSTTMTTIILPQALKNVLPALGNEFISLLKETSVVSIIGLMDLTRAGDVIKGKTYDAFMPLIAVALIYLVIVIGLSSLVSLMERKLKKNER